MTIAAIAAHRDAIWSLQEFVDVANDLLPRVLPRDASGRTTDEINPRLVRHYTTQGLLPEPGKDGREARYLFEHLLHVLVVRKLFAEGFTSNAIRSALQGRSQQELQSLLQGTVRVELVPDPATEGERAAFLQRIRQRAGLDTAGAQAPAAPGPSNPPTAESVETDAPAGMATIFKEVGWTRIQMLDGLELHVRDDFRLPTTRLGDEQIADLVKVVLLHLEQTRKGKA